MVTRGRNICNTLKAIRKQIADANGIDYSPEECNYKGECMGTCPKCEQDVRDLEYELHLRQMAGKAIKVAGIAAGLVAMTACSDGKVQRISSDATKSELNIVKKEEPKPGDRQLEGDISHKCFQKTFESNVTGFFTSRILPCFTCFGHTLTVFLNCLADCFFIRTIHNRLSTLTRTCLQAFDAIFFITFYPCVDSRNSHLKYFCYLGS